MTHDATVNAPPLVTFGMIGIALTLAVLLVAGMRAVGRSALAATVGVAAWMAAFAAAAASGLLARFDQRPPPFALALVAIVAGAIVFARSRAAAALAAGLPLAALVGAQAFRLPLELVMHEAAKAGVMPPQMSFSSDGSGWNFDIVSGASAILVALLAAAGRAPRWLLLAWNALGSALLLAIVAIAVASTPMVHAFGGGAALNTWVAYFPFVWLPSVMVAFALAGHLLLWRRLLA
jgi:hypothetical protein